MTERPLECSECKKPADVLYTEITNDRACDNRMCRDCPVLEQKLKGSCKETTDTKHPGILCCEVCMTSREAIRRGEPTGCPKCYGIFETILLEELLRSDGIPLRAAEHPSGNFHFGKTPRKTHSVPYSERFSSLRTALNEALQKEHYEQAAKLRDRIKELETS